MSDYYRRKYQSRFPLTALSVLGMVVGMGILAVLIFTKIGCH